jgi:hypothetical protein
MNPKTQLTIIILIILLTVIAVKLGAIKSVVDKAANAIGNAAFDASTPFVEER